MPPFASPFGNFRQINYGGSVWESNPATLSATDRSMALKARVDQGRRAGEPVVLNGIIPSALAGRLGNQDGADTRRLGYVRHVDVRQSRLVQMRQRKNKLESKIQNLMDAMSFTGIQSPCLSGSLCGKARS
jgi:hypothetical protein